MATRKPYSIKFDENEMRTIESQAKQKGMGRSEYIRHAALKQNEYIGENLIKPLCEMRRFLSEYEASSEDNDNELTLKMGRICDSLWQSVNL